jgi:hypothetical protein
MAQAMDHRGCNGSWRTGKKGHNHHQHHHHHRVKASSREKGGGVSLEKGRKNSERASRSISERPKAEQGFLSNFINFFCTLGLIFSLAFLTIYSLCFSLRLSFCLFFPPPFLSFPSFCFV